MPINHTPPHRDNNPTDVKDASGKVTHREHSFKDNNNQVVLVVKAPAGYTPTADPWKSDWDTKPNAPQVPIINLVLRDNQGTAKTNFDGASFKLRVKKLGKYKKVKYYNLDWGQWVDLSESNDEFVLESDKWWTDPPVGGDPF